METKIKNGLISSMVLLFILLAIIIAYVIWNKIKHKNRKGRGKKFEQEFSQELYKWSQKNNFLYLAPSLYKIDKKLFEIDGILISDIGILVIETKSISGNVEGDYKDKFWYKVFKNKKYEITNAIKQNEKHINHLADILNDTNINIYSIIIFEDFNNKIKIDNNPEWNLITKDTSFVNDISRFIETTEKEYNQNTIDSVYNKILSHKTNSSKDKAKFKSYRFNFD